MEAGPWVSIDPNGNLCAEGGNGTCTDINATKRYEWDAENRLLAVKQGAATLASFTYDGGGRRATKTASGVTTTYLYDGANYLEERPTVGSTKRYVYGAAVDQPLAQVISGTTTFNITDHLGSLVRTTDTGGAPISALDRQYDPWGNLLQGSTVAGYAFTGREWDPETGLYYYRARYYESAAGRFVSEDDLDFAAGFSAYAYVRGRVTVAIDPSGLLQFKTDGPYPALPPSGVLLMNLLCLEECMGRTLRVTSTHEPVPSHMPSAGPFPRNPFARPGEPYGGRDPFDQPPPHGMGLAADVQPLPWGAATPPQDVTDEFFCCAKACSFKFAQNEYPLSRHHFHVQMVPGKRGGSGDLPPNGDPKCQCKK